MYTILVVEDDSNTNEGVCEYLGSIGYEVLPAFDGEEAIALFSQRHVDLVLLDTMLRPMS